MQRSIFTGRFPEWPKPPTGMITGRPLKRTAPRKSTRYLVWDRSCLKSGRRKNCDPLEFLAEGRNSWMNRQAVPFIRFLSRFRQILNYGQGARPDGLMKAFSKREREVRSGPMSDQELARAIRQIRYSAFAGDKNSAKPLRGTDQTASIERRE
jgi:hypothetical protein